MPISSFKLFWFREQQCYSMWSTNRACTYDLTIGTLYEVRSIHMLKKLTFTCSLREGPNSCISGNALTTHDQQSCTPSSNYQAMMKAFNIPLRVKLEQKKNRPKGRPTVLLIQRLGARVQDGCHTKMPIHEKNSWITQRRAPVETTFLKSTLSTAK